MNEDGPSGSRPCPEAERAEQQRAPILWRLWEERDLEQIMELEPVLFGEDAWPRESFEAEMFQPQTREYWVAEQGEELLAYGGVMVIPPVGDIQTVGVAPGAQGRGLGRELMGLLLEACRLRGAESALLEVKQSNEPAIALYRSLGFEQIHIRPRYYRSGESAVIMQLALSTTGPQEQPGERA